MEKKVRRPGFLAAMALCFSIAAIAFAGIILPADMVGRVIFGIVWTAIGFIWLGWYFGFGKR